ncbi:hypothetical protein FIBSPDRAFT_749570, partial [Athelia psychrophila]
MRQVLARHHCARCDVAITLVKAVRASNVPRVAGPALKAVRKVHRKLDVVGRLEVAKADIWPPSPPSVLSQAQIVREFCKRQARENVEEIGCAVCAQLTLKSDAKFVELSEYSDILLSPVEGTRKERKDTSDPICELDGALLANTNNYACSDCHSLITRRKTPLLSLANSLWLGDVPASLQGLTYAEKMLVARVRHNRCVMRVTQGAHKMCANAISFENPTALVYDT